MENSINIDPFNRKDLAAGYNKKVTMFISTGEKVKVSINAGITILELLKQVSKLVKIPAEHMILYVNGTAYEKDAKLSKEFLKDATSFYIVVLEEQFLQRNNKEQDEIKLLPKKIKIKMMLVAFSKSFEIEVSPLSSLQELRILAARTLKIPEKLILFRDKRGETFTDYKKRILDYKLVNNSALYIVPILIGAAKPSRPEPETIGAIMGALLGGPIGAILGGILGARVSKESFSLRSFEIRIPDAAQIFVSKWHKALFIVLPYYGPRRKTQDFERRELYLEKGRIKVILDDHNTKFRPQEFELEVRENEETKFEFEFMPTRPGEGKIIAEIYRIDTPISYLVGTANFDFKARAKREKVTTLVVKKPNLIEEKTKMRLKNLIEVMSKITKK